MFICRKWGKAATSIFTCEKSFFFTFITLSVIKKNIHKKEYTYFFVFAENGKTAFQQVYATCGKFFLSHMEKMKKGPNFLHAENG